MWLENWKKKINSLYFNDVDKTLDINLTFKMIFLSYLNFLKMVKDMYLFISYLVILLTV